MLQELLVNLATKIELEHKMTQIDEKLNDILKTISTVTTKTEQCDQQETMTEDKVNGVLISRIPARDAYAFGLRLLDVLFTKEELGSSLLFKTKKSDWTLQKYNSFCD